MNSLLRAAAILTLCSGFIACRHTAKVVAPPPSPPLTGSITLPAGSTLAIRTADPIDSSQAIPDRAYAAVISRDVKGSETQMALPTGSPATLVLLGTANSGMWQLGLASLTINGDSFLVSANTSSGLPLGAYLGGVPGTVYPAKLDKDKPAEPSLTVSGALIQIPSGSLLTFRLGQEITLRDWHK